MSIGMKKCQVTRVLCVYNTPSSHDACNIFEDWSSEGCKEDREEDRMGNGVTCRCNHLTTFGVLVVSYQLFLAHMHLPIA